MRVRERQCERSKPESRENENSVKETAETSPDVSLHTLSGSITHGNPRGKQNPQAHRQYKDMLILTSVAETITSKPHLYRNDSLF